MSPRKSIFTLGTLLAMVVMVFSYAKVLKAKDVSTGTIKVKTGQKIAFLGDSITQYANRRGGYIYLVVEILKKNGIDVSYVPAGVSGNKSNQLLTRLERDVLSKKPQWMTLSCGVNDAWQGANLEDYKKNMTEIVTRAQAKGIKVMILTSTMLTEDPKHVLNQKVVPYNEFLKKLAVEKKCLLADLNSDMQAALKTFPKDSKKGKELTGDGVHMNNLGNIMMAKGVLRAFGVGEDVLATAEKKWRQKPGMENVFVHLNFSINEMQQLKALAEKNKTSVEELFKKALLKESDSLLTR